MKTATLETFYHMADTARGFIAGREIEHINSGISAGAYTGRWSVLFTGESEYQPVDKNTLVDIEDTSASRDPFVITETTRDAWNNAVSAVHAWLAEGDQDAPPALELKEACFKSMLAFVLAVDAELATSTE